MKKINLAIIFGGQSLEHEVSLESAKSVYSLCMQSKMINPALIYINKKGEWFVARKDFFENKKVDEKVICDFSTGFVCGKRSLNIDVAFSVIHGNTGEDGKLQGLLELLKIPYVGCSVMASAISMDKMLTKTLAALNGVPVLPDILVETEDLKNFSSLKYQAYKLGYPVFVKPNTLGSSVGVSKVKSEKELLLALKKALKNDRQVLIEKGVDMAREIVCGLLGDYSNVSASPCAQVRVKGRHEFYDYSAKYLDNDGMELLIPAPISKRSEKRIKDYALKVFKAIKGYGMARADFFINPRNEEEIYFCEINVIPGFTSHSLYPRLWGSSAIKQVKLIEKLVILALKK